MIQLSQSAFDDLELDDSAWRFDDLAVKHECHVSHEDDQDGSNPRHAAAWRTFEPIRRQARAAMPVGASLAQSRALRKGRARIKTRHKHLLFDGKHHRRRNKRIPADSAMAVTPS